MCKQVLCRSCGKPTWAGCGAHIEQALANVPPDQRCKCSPGAKGPAADKRGPSGR
jgi:hypothetical protein